MVKVAVWWLSQHDPACGCTLAGDVGRQLAPRIRGPESHGSRLESLASARILAAQVLGIPSEWVVPGSTPRATQLATGVVWASEIHHSSAARPVTYVRAPTAGRAVRSASDRSSWPVLRQLTMAMSGRISRASRTSTEVRTSRSGEDRASAIALRKASRPSTRRPAMFPMIADEVCKERRASSSVWAACARSNDFPDGTIVGFSHDLVQGGHAEDARS
jgi:hypothetical protein